jgi:hypothetical protein
MKLTSLAALPALLTGCAAELPQWRAETVPAILVPAAPAVAVKPRACAPLPSEITAEAARMAPLDDARVGGVAALSAALMGSEARKNARLRQAVQAYERCRRS